MNKKGQSVLEYVIILTAVIAAIILFAGRLGPKVGDSLDHAADQMQSEVNKISF